MTKAFNAYEALKGYDPAEARIFKPSLNGLSEGGEYSFDESDQFEWWAKKEVRCAVTDTGILCIPQWLANCVDNDDKVYKNLESSDTNYHCVVQKWADSSVKCLNDFVSEQKQEFPRIRIKRRLPVAIRKEELLSSNNPTVLETYRKEFGKELKDIPYEWVPSLRLLQNGRTGVKYIKKAYTCVFELV